MSPAILRKLSFCFSFALAWYVTGCVLSVLTSMAGSHDLSGWESAAAGVAVHTLSVAAGFCYARGRVRGTKPEPRGFPVIHHSDGPSGGT